MQRAAHADEQADKGRPDGQAARRNHQASQRAGVMGI